MFVVVMCPEIIPLEDSFPPVLWHWQKSINV